MRNDLLDVLMARLEEAGIEHVVPTMADGRRLPECCALAFGVPERGVAYMDGSQEDRLRVTVLCRRIREEDAMADAWAAEGVLRSSDLASANGSYQLSGVEALPAKPIPWDESGRYVWCAEAYVKTKREDFF